MRKPTSRRSSTQEDEIDLNALTKSSEAAPVVKLVNVLLIDSLKRGASDIHIEPYEKEFRVRFRIDGILYNVMALPLRLRDPLISRVKIMAKLDISEKRLPQDGRIKIRFEDRGPQPRHGLPGVGVCPTLWGEKVVHAAARQVEADARHDEARLRGSVSRRGSRTPLPSPTGSFS